MSTDLTRLTAALADRYRIERELGAGGMATVYLAHDLRHEREVAIKVLHPDLGAALGAERFLSEIKTTAKLSHPHILPLLDSGAADGFLFYVMPYVTGETLRSRLERERQLPIDDALRIAREVAGALSAAHALGIIHRDIKPENILLQGGHALVADFGIALAVQSAGGARMTQTGLSLGTPQYMSPEQAMGERTLDARTDVYALGAVTYEMLSGDPPFTGSSVQAIVARLLAERPTPITTLRDTVSPAVEEVVLRALAKLPADRQATARAFAEELHSASTSTFTRPRAAGASAQRPGLVAWMSRHGGMVAFAALLGVAMIEGVAMFAGSRRNAVAAMPAVQLMLDVPSGSVDLSRFAVSSRGDAFAFAMPEGLMVRAPGEREYRLLSGTRNAESPSFSEDGQWIAYHAAGRLSKVAVSGGSIVALVPGDSLRAGEVTWGADGSIVFESAARLFVIAPDGGAPRLLAGAPGASSPRILPDGSGLLYLDMRSGSKLMYYDMRADTAVVVLEESAVGQYANSGHIVFSHPAGGLFAIGFDAKRWRTTGVPVPLVADMQARGAFAGFALTGNGMLLYRAGLDPESRLLIREPDGRLDTLPMSPRVLGYARFSPDGRSLAVTIGSARGTNRHTTILGLDHGSLAQFTFEGGGHAPVWSPDGTRIAFTAELPGADAEDLYVQPVDRSTPPRRLARIPDDQHVSDWPRDDLLIVSDANRPMAGGRGGRIVLLDPAVTDGKPTPFSTAQWAESDLVVSPDGRWAAYVSSESGPDEVYVRAFPDQRAGGQHKISSGGGDRPRWGPGGRTVLYQSADQTTIHEVRVSAGPPFTVGAKRMLLQLPSLGPAWDVDRRTGRIVVAPAVGEATQRMIMVLDWMALYRARAPGAVP